LEKKFMHVANEVNQNAPEKSKFFPIGRWGGKEIKYIFDFHISHVFHGFPTSF
jgi:hypothetical protein